MKILLTGDSITDMNRNSEIDPYEFGRGYPIFVQGELATKFPQKHKVINRGISGNRIVDLYSRIKIDCWNLEPDLISILIGVNDVLHEVAYKNGVELSRYENVYRMIIEETKSRLPNVKFMLLEPFILKGTATQDNFEFYCSVYEYAKVVKKLANEYGLVFVPLQEKFNDISKQTGESYYLYDGVHPTAAGAKVIADEWLKAFYNNF